MIAENTGAKPKSQNSKSSEPVSHDALKKFGRAEKWLFSILVHFVPAPTLAFNARFSAGRFCAQDTLRNTRRNVSANTGVANLCLLTFSGNHTRHSCIGWNNWRHRSSPNRA